MRVTRSPSRRQANAIVIVMAILLLLGLLLTRLGIVSSGQARLTHTHEQGAELLYRAESPVARTIKRLLQRGWEVRYYAEGPPGTGPYGTRHQGEYRGGSFELWVQDVELASTAAAPGMTDLFVEMLFEGRFRRYHYRVTILPASLRRRRTVAIEYFGSRPEDFQSLEGRQRAADEATGKMVESEVNRATSEALLEEALGDPGTLEADEAAEALLQEVVEEASTRREDARKALEKGVHLLGQDGRGMQSVLPPLQRRRFLTRAPNLEKARAQLTRAVELSERAPEMRVLAGIALVRALLGEAWRRGPASSEAQELLEAAWAELEALATFLDGLAPEILARLDPTLRASVLLARVRAATIGNWRERLDESMALVARADDLSRLYGGSEQLEEVLDRLLDSLRTPWSLTRIRSAEPMPESGLRMVEEDEVDDFLQDPEAGWQEWPTDGGMDEDWWRRHWEDRLDREGEGGTEEASANVDRDGDGLADEDSDIDGPDSDGDGLPDDLPGATLLAPCLDACVDEDDGEVDEDCVQGCQATAGAAATAASAGASSNTTGAGPMPDPTAVGGNFREEVVDIPEQRIVRITPYLSTSGMTPASLEVIIEHAASGTQQVWMTWVRQHTSDTSPLYLAGKPIPRTISVRGRSVVPVATTWSYGLQPGDRVITRLRGGNSAGYVTVR